MDSIVIYKKVTNIFIYTCVCKKNRGPREAEKLHRSAITYKKGLRREKSGAKGKVGTALWKTILPIPKKKKREIKVATAGTKIIIKNWQAEKWVMAWTRERS